MHYFFMLGWGRCGFQKKHAGTGYTEFLHLHPWDLQVT
jgi:hypothetical protein